MKKLALAAAAALTTLTLGVASPASAEESASTQTILEIAAGNPDFSLLVAAVDAAGLEDLFNYCGDQPVTVLAPTNAAFTAALTALDLTLEELVANTALLRNILLYHVVPGSAPAATVVTLDRVTAYNGQTITIDASSGVKLNGTVNVVVTDIMACNGVIHVLDAVLVPELHDLPETGSPATSMSIVAGLLLAFGLGANLLVRRRTVTV